MFIGCRAWWNIIGCLVLRCRVFLSITSVAAPSRSDAFVCWNGCDADYGLGATVAGLRLLTAAGFVGS